MLLDFLKARREEILAVARKYGAYNVRVFGSVLYGTERLDSDVDLLVDFEPERSLLDEVGLAQELEALLGKRVDVAEPDALHWFVKDKILREARPL